MLRLFTNSAMKGSMQNMKLCKKLLAAACASALLAGAFAALPQGFDKLGASLGVSAETYGDYAYRVLDDGTVEITGYIGSGTEAIIPLEIDGKKVTSIGGVAFGFCTSLTSVTIPDTVTSIGDNAFR